MEQQIEDKHKHNILILTMTVANKEGLNDKEQENNNDACIAPERLKEVNGVPHNGDVSAPRLQRCCHLYNNVHIFFYLMK